MKITTFRPRERTVKGRSLLSCHPRQALWLSLPPDPGLWCLFYPKSGLISSTLQQLKRETYLN